MYDASSAIQQRKRKSSNYILCMTLCTTHFLPFHWLNVVCCTCILPWPIIAHWTSIQVATFFFFWCTPDEARDGLNVAFKWQLEVTSHMLACLIVQNNHPTINSSMPITFMPIWILPRMPLVVHNVMSTHLLWWFKLPRLYTNACVHLFKCNNCTIV